MSQDLQFLNSLAWRKVQAPEEAPIYISDVVELEDGERETKINMACLVTKCLISLVHVAMDSKNWRKKPSCSRLKIYGE